MRHDTVGAILVALASLFFGGVVVVGKVVTDGGLPVSTMLSVRFAVAAAILAAAALVRRGTVRAARGEGWKLAVLGAVGYAGEAGLFFLAIARGTASAVSLLFFVYPVLVTAVSAVLGLAVPGALLLGSLAAAVVGTSLVIASAGGISITSTGIAFALSAAAIFGLYLLGAERTLRRTTSIVGAFWVSASASAALAVLALASGARLPRGGEWLGVAAIGAFTAGAFLCLFAGLRRVGAVRTSIIAALEPLSTALLAAVFLGERMRAGTLVGALLILGGATAASVARGGAPELDASVP